MISYGIVPLAAVAQIQVSGNIHPNAIQIDSSANHHAVNPQGVTVLNGNAAIDWVKDYDDNQGAGGTFGDGIANGIIVGTTGAADVGDWHGVRIVDGFGGGDQNIFLKGGKVNEPDSWDIGPGSIGSSKYDATQMYIANNQTDIFFGMERNGNNGTTAFDWEFNQLPPKVFVDDPATVDVDEGRLNGYVPVRSDGDVLITFELQGSGGSSGSVATFIFKFDGDDPNDPDDPAPNVYVQCTGVQNPPLACQNVSLGSVVTSINGIAPTPAEPWGYVNGGSWVLEPGFALRMFAEAKVSLSLLPGVETCGGSGFVGIRTRASSTLGSDAKDTTKIFKYVFGGPTAEGALTSGCGLDIHYDAAGSENASGGSTGLSYEWRFEKLVSGVWVDAFDTDPTKSPADEPADRTDVSGNITAPGPGTYRAKLKVIENTDCFDEIVVEPAVTVFNGVGGSVSLTADCDDTFTYNAQGTGGSGNYTFEWKIFRVGTVLPVHQFSSLPIADNPNTTNVDESDPTRTTGTLDIDDFGGQTGQYYAEVTIIDHPHAAGAGHSSDCNVVKTSDPINVRRAVGGTASLTANCTDTFEFTAQGTGGSGTYSYAWTFYKENGATDLLAGESNLKSGTIDVDTLLGDGQYYAVVRITDTNNTDCFFDVTTNAINVRHPLTVTLAKGDPVVNTNNLDASFSVSVTGTVGNGGDDTIVKAWEQSANGTTWSSVGTNSLTLSRTMADIISGGTAVAEPNLVQILGDPYRIVVTSLRVKLTVSRSGLGEAQACPVTSEPLIVKSAKAVDP